MKQVECWHKGGNNPLVMVDSGSEKGSQRMNSNLLSRQHNSDIPGKGK